MEIKVIEQNKKKIIFELIGADHTFCNALKKELLTDDNVKVATYAIAHPLINIPKFIVETGTQKEPAEVLKAGANRLMKLNKEFLAAFKKAK
jgi:DNA-directed RNA polymerase subunit L